MRIQSHVLACAVIAAGCSAPQYTVVSGTSASARPAPANTYPNVGEVQQAAQTRSDDVAIVVAIEDYAFLPDVAGAVENANAWENYLKNGRGFAEVFVLTNKQAPIEEIKQFAQRAASATKPGGALWFVFIGHGAALTDGTDGAIIGMDAQQTVTSIENRSISQTELLQTLKSGQQSHTVVVLDTCFSGRDTTGNLLAEGTQPVVAINTSPVTASTVVLSAAGGDEVAGQLPGLARPAFSYLLLGAMRGWADDGDGQVTADEAITWTRQQLRHVSGRQQTPAVAGDAQFVLASAARENDPGIVDIMKGGGQAAAPSTPQPQANSDSGPMMVDTGKGFMFAQHPDWGAGPVGLGMLVNLASSYSGNRIMVRRQKVRKANAAHVLGAPQTLDSQELEMIRDPAPATYGQNTGRELEFRLKTSFGEGTDTEVEHAIRFGTHQNGYAWIIDLVVVEPSSRDADYEQFQQFLAQMRFPPVSK